MEAVLRRYTKQEQQEEIQFGPILINEKSRKIEADGEPISLTVKEFDLLYFLCQHTGQVFSGNNCWKRYGDMIMPEVQEQ